MRFINNPFYISAYISRLSAPSLESVHNLEVPRQIAAESTGKV